MRCGWCVAVLLVFLLAVPLSNAVVNSADCSKQLALGLPCVSSSASSGVSGSVGAGGSASSPPSNGGVSSGPAPTPPTPPLPGTCQASSEYSSCIASCAQNFGPDDQSNLADWTNCRLSCNKNYGTCTGTCPATGEACKPSTEKVGYYNSVTQFSYSIDEIKCGCAAATTPELPKPSGCQLNSDYSACTANCQKLESSGKADEAFSCYQSCERQFSFKPAGVAANSVCSGDACKDGKGNALKGYCRPTQYSNKRNSAGETVLLATACGCQAPDFGHVYYCNAPGDLTSQNYYNENGSSALNNIKPGDQWAGGGVFCRDQCARFGPEFSCSARNSGCFCECDAAKLNCPPNQTADTKTCQCVANTTRNVSNGTSGTSGCAAGQFCCGSANDLMCGGACPPGQYCSIVGYNSTNQSLGNQSGRNLCQCVGPLLVDKPCENTTDCNGFCGAGAWCAMAKSGACVCTSSPPKLHVDVLVLKTPIKVGDTGPIQAHVYWDDGTPASGTVTFMLGSSSRSETLDSAGTAKVWGKCLASGTTPARAIYRGIEGSAPFTCVD